MNEEWRPVVGYEGLYSVSSLGRVRSEARRVNVHHGGTRPVRERIRKLTPDKDGYLHVSLHLEQRSENCRVATLVAAAFIGPKPDGLWVLHCDGSNQNNVPANLRYGTPTENRDDCRKHGTMPVGVRSGTAKLSDAKVAALRAATGSHRDLAREFGVCPQNVSRIRRRESWRHVHGV